LFATLKGQTMPYKRRLSAKINLLRIALADEKWHTLDDLAKTTDSPEASVSANIRNLRKVEFGSHRIDRRPIVHSNKGAFGGTQWEYRMVT
jgi:hypothetical protein